MIKWFWRACRMIFVGPFSLSGGDQCSLCNAGVCFCVYPYRLDVILLAQYFFGSFAPQSDLASRLFSPPQCCYSVASCQRKSWRCQKNLQSSDYRLHNVLQACAHLRHLISARMAAQNLHLYLEQHFPAGSETEVFMPDFTLCNQSVSKNVNITVIRIDIYKIWLINTQHAQFIKGFFPAGVTSTWLSFRKLHDYTVL